MREKSLLNNDLQRCGWMKINRIIISGISALTFKHWQHYLNIGETISNYTCAWIGILSQKCLMMPSVWNCLWFMTLIRFGLQEDVKLEHISHFWSTLNKELHYSPWILRHLQDLPCPRQHPWMTSQLPGLLNLSINSWVPTFIWQQTRHEQSIDMTCSTQSLKFSHSFFKPLVCFHLCTDRSEKCVWSSCYLFLYSETLNCIFLYGTFKGSFTSNVLLSWVDNEVSWLWQSDGLWMYKTWRQLWSLTCVVKLYLMVVNQTLPSMSELDCWGSSLQTNLCDIAWSRAEPQLPSPPEGTVGYWWGFVSFLLHASNHHT